MPDEKSNDMRTILFSLGTGDNLGKSKNVKESVSKFIDRFRKPHVTPEKYREYKVASDKRQRFLKGSAGWFMRGGVEKGQNRNRNSIMPSQIITLDIDYATPEFGEMLMAGKILPGYRLIAHTTRSHTPEKLRFRIMIFLSGKVSRERYQAASRIVAQMADPEMQWVDKVSFRPAQMMYMPTVSADMEKYYVFYEQKGELLDHEEVISHWELLNGSSEDIGNLPRTVGEDELREAAESAENPLEKKGPVGDWCRAYTITELVVGKDGEPGILADVYEPVEWSQGAISRMSYLGGTTSNGAVVYDDMWVYSHHGSDPCQEMLVNAYDLVRIHKFGKEDKDQEKDTPLKDLPSSKKMLELMRGDGYYRQQQAESRYDLESMLQDDDVEYETEHRPGASESQDVPDEDEDAEIEALLGVPIDAVLGNRAARRAHRRRLAQKPPERWIAKELELTDDGVIKTTLHNIATIIMNDPRFWRKIAYNEFNYQIVVTGDIRSKTKLIPEYLCKDKENGDRWQEINDIIIRALIEGPTSGPNGGTGYGIKVGKELVHDAVRLAARVNSFHPIREFLLDCDKNAEETPGCIDTVLIDYFHAEDNVYTRQASRKMLIAAVARVMEPGCKFDFAMILEGEQGLGKSTGIKRLFGESYFGEIDANLSDRKQTAEQMAGKWALELPELSSLNKGEANDNKAFMSRQYDDVRLSYDRNVSELPRQCVIFGTTNDTEYLRDTTGGRRYWPMPIANQFVDVPGIMRARASIWQDAYRAYLEMRAKTPEGHDLPLHLTGEAAEIAKTLQERARKTEQWETWLERVEDWMDEEHTLQSFIDTTGGNLEDTLDDSHMGTSLESIVCRVAFTMDDVLQVAFNQHGSVPNNAQADQAYKKVRSELIKRGWHHNQDNAIRIGGKKARWVTRPDITAEERAQGFRVLNPAQAPGIAPTQVDDDDLI